MGLQGYFGALSTADRARHYNSVAYVLLQQSWLCLRASSGMDLASARHTQGGGAEQPAREPVYKLNRRRWSECVKQAAGSFFLLPRL